MKYQQKTLEILSYLYQLRVLNQDLLFDYCFATHGLSSWYAYKVMKYVYDNGYVKKQYGEKKNCVYSISRKGVDFLRKHGLIQLGDEIPTLQESLLPPSKISLKEFAFEHQLHLNRFVLRFKDEFRDIEFQYFDEKFLSFLPNVRPDGMIKIGNQLIFLEMDMGTERKQSLQKKWNQYRGFLNSQFYYDLDEKITVLFITNKKNTSRRKTLQSYIAPYLLDKINDDFNIFIGDEDVLFQYLHNFIEQRDCFPVKLLSFARSKNYTTNGLQDFVFDNYIVQLENGYIKRENGELLEFLFDDYTIDNLYVFRKVKFMKSLVSSMKTQINRTMKYIILVSSEKEALDLLVRTDSFLSNVYFLTNERLINGTFYEALFQVDRDGAIMHFANNNLGIKIPEKKIGSFERR